MEIEAKDAKLAQVESCLAQQAKILEKADTLLQTKCGEFDGKFKLCHGV